jgi:transposase
MNVIAAMTATKMLYWECSFQSTDADRYASFISNMINSNRGLFESKHCHIVHDGVNFHKSDKVLLVLEGQRLQHSFEVIPAYSSSLNAIENAWKVVRDNARARFSELLDLRVSLQQLIEESIEQVTQQQCEGFHAGVKDALASCLEARPLSMNSSSWEFSIDVQPLRYQDQQSDVYSEDPHEDQQQHHEFETGSE